MQDHFGTEARSISLLLSHKRIFYRKEGEILNSGTFTVLFENSHISYTYQFFIINIHPCSFDRLGRCSPIQWSHHIWAHYFIFYFQITTSNSFNIIIYLSYFELKWIEMRQLTEKRILFFIVWGRCIEFRLFFEYLLFYVLGKALGEQAHLMT